MKRNIVRTIFFATLVLSLAAVAPAQADGACSPDMLVGTWGYSETGTLYNPAYTGPYASLGSFTIDADGNVSGARTASAGGTIVTATLKGTATVNSDCTGTLTVGFYDQSGNLTSTAVKAVVYADNAREARAIITSSQSVLTTTLKKLFSVPEIKLVLQSGESQPSTSAQADGTCTLASRAGDYAYTWTGTMVLPTGAVPAAGVGRSTFDEAGNMSATQTVSRGGTVSQVTVKGTYTVNPDCTGTITANTYDQAGNLSNKVTWLTVTVNNMTETYLIMTSMVSADGTNIPVIITNHGTKLFPVREIKLVVQNGESQPSR